MSTSVTNSRVAIHEFLLPKSDFTLAECEDWLSFNRTSLRFAVADGATEAFDAASWSKRLALGWVALENDCLDADSLLNWAEAEGDALRASWQGLKLSWFAEEKARIGSFAAFAGMKLSPENGTWRWQAITIGDTCVFHLRGRTLIGAVPISDSGDFGTAPVLLASNNPDRPLVRSSIVAAHGQAVRGDELVLMSDAIAAWFLSRATVVGGYPSCFLEALQLGDEMGLNAIVETERSKGCLKDDDISIIHVRV